MRELHSAVVVDEREQLHAAPGRLQVLLPGNGAAGVGRKRVVRWRGVLLPGRVPSGAGRPRALRRAVQKLRGRPGGGGRSHQGPHARTSAHSCLGADRRADLLADRAGRQRVRAESELRRERLVRRFHLRRLVSAAPRGGLPLAAVRREQPRAVSRARAGARARDRGEQAAGRVRGELVAVPEPGEGRGLRQGHRLLRGQLRVEPCEEPVRSELHHRNARHV
mmetsp:Transcript_106632/g.281253  ORF Transcript_106632/g.281253 Transcript_106632/m.281253 type:complete len:222 (-) Transcript_106632:698-1363(-)